MADKFERYGIPVRLENTPIFKRILQKLMNKVSGGTAGNFAMLDADGNVADSGKSANDFAPSAENGYVEKQTTTSASWRLYAYTNEGDGSLPITSGTDGTTAPTTTGSVVITTAGRIRTNTPTGPYHAANKEYVDDAIAALRAELTK